MKTIYKYPIGSEAILELPRDAEVLTVQTQQGQLMLWVLLNPEAPKVPRRFVSYQTGQKVPVELTKRKYVGTVQLRGGNYILHVFEVK